MKKRIILFTSIVIIFSLTVMSSFFFVISNHRYIKTSKEILKEYNEIVSILIRNDNNAHLQEKLKSLDKSGVRVTYINNKGNVIFDNYKYWKSMDNHSDREEIIQAKKNGYGESVRYSEALKSNMIYYASKFSNGSVVRTAINIDNFNMFEGKNIIYYIIALVLSILIAIGLSVKITNIIIDPLKELEFITSRIANGELNRRVTIREIKELASVGESFNHMANRLEETLEDSLDKKNKLEAILKSMDSGIIAIDKNLKVIMINPYAKKIFGISENIIGKKITEYLNNKEVLRAIKERVDYEEVSIDYPVYRNLRIKTAEIINGYEHIGIVAVLYDITNFKKLENMRTQFVANISHEIKTPLTSIKGFAETLKYVDDEETRQKFLNIINDESDRLARLIEDILVLYDIEQKKDPVLEMFSINEVIDNVYMLVMNEANKKNISIKTEYKDNICIVGDKDKFKQMLLNIVYNGVKYTEEGGHIKIASYIKNSNLIVKISDTGIGISKEDLPRIFERFYRVDKARSRASGGTGLGLAIVKHIVNLFDGEITVKSSLGKGTIFTIVIPINI
ncbi:two-component system histidine kinase PnpS [Clostridium tarantellae]|uniref:histidine kinase n=1 Tax=Clostridium tarantellae TaxID=39493 RepID=A0A6I1MGH0_9CLOT|nr:ATP-binding protein [Clostridium tarantellae]MPQ42465.1 HAMP domain-containing protein [Clostridium tarantellae]